MNTLNWSQTPFKELLLRSSKFNVNTFFLVKKEKGTPFKELNFQCENHITGKSRGLKFTFMVRKRERTNIKIAPRFARPTQLYYSSDFKLTYFGDTIFEVERRLDDTHDNHFFPSPRKKV